MVDDIITYKQLLQKREIILDYTLSEAIINEIIQDCHLLELKDVKAKITAKPILSSHGILIDMELMAISVQPCIVTLAPVPQHIHEKAIIRFVPETAKPKTDLEEAELYLNPNGEIYDDEPLIDDQIILADIVREHIILALEEFPRVANAEFKGHIRGELTTEEQKILSENLQRVEQGLPPVNPNNPFAALKKIKQNLEETD